MGNEKMSIDVDELAQEIRHVDGEHKLGAGQLAEALMPFLSRRTAPAEPVAYLTETGIPVHPVQLPKPVRDAPAKHGYTPLYAAPPVAEPVAAKPPVEIPGYARKATAYGNSYVRQPEPSADDAGAKLLADWIGYSWDGLREGRIGDRGFPQWPRSGAYQGGKQDLRDLAAAIAAASIHSDRAPTLATHRHKRRGTEYVLIGYGTMQAKRWAELGVRETGEPTRYTVDMREVAIYRSATDQTEIWVRPLEEFEDGRFEALGGHHG